MASELRHKFKQHYAALLKKEAEQFQEPLLSIEEEFNRISKKHYGHHRFQKQHTLENLTSNVEYVEKLQSFLNVPDSKAFKDLTVLNQLAEFNEDAHKELTNLKEGLYAVDSINHKKRLDATHKKRNSKLESFHRVQRVIDKEVLQTVKDLEVDLSLLPEKQKTSRVVDRLSSVKIPSSNTFKEAVKLPSLDTPKTVKPSVKQVDLTCDLTQIKSDSKSSIFSPSLVLSTEPQKALAGFYIKEKKSKHNADKEKEQIRKDCVGNFVKHHKKVKTMAGNYLFNLTHYNSPSMMDQSGLRETETSVCYNNNNQKSDSNLISKVVYLPEHVESLSARTFHSYMAANNFGLNSSIQEKRPQKPKKLPNLTQEKNNALFPVTERRGSILKGTLLNLNSRKEVEKSEKDLTEEWMKEALSTLETPEPFVYEGLGLLTLHNGRKNAPQNPTEFKISHVNMGIKRLRKADYDYVEKKTGVDLRHCLYDRKIADKDALRFGPDALKLL